MTVPAVTAVIPVRHYHPTYLRRAIESVLDQSSPDWRLLIVADRELDAPFLSIVEPATTDRRVQVIPCEGSGLAAALNTSFRHAETDFVGILLGDDTWAPEAVETLADRIAAEPDVDVFHSSRRFVDGDGRPLSSPYPARDGFTLADFLDGSPARHLLCVRRSAALAIGGVDETLAPVGPDDYDFPWSLAESGARFRAVPECLYLLRDHRDGERLTTHLPRSVHVRALRRMLRKHGVGWWQRERRVARAKRGYLRQCLYRNRLDRHVKRRLGHDPQRGWREPYR